MKAKRKNLGKVLIVQPIAKEGIELLLKHGCEIKQLKSYSPDTLKDEIVDADAILIRNAHLSREIIEKGCNLKVISRHGSGMENVDVKTATEKKIYVTNTPVANSTSVAEHIIGMMLALAKNLMLMDNATRKGHFDIRHQLYSVELKGKTLGIIGLGNVGRRVASIASKGLQMNAIGYDPFISDQPIDTSIRLTNNWQKMLEESDFISLNLPLNKKTAAVIGKKEFDMMKNTAFLINCARGALVDESELINALKQGRIAGAAIDVYSEDPPPVDHPFFSMKNVILTPHTAAHSNEAMKNMAIQAAQGIIEVLSSKTPTWPVNKFAINQQEDIGGNK